MINDIYNNNDNTSQWHLLVEWASIHSNNVYLYRDEIIWRMLTAELNQAIEKISASLTLSFDLGLSAHGREYSYKLPWLIVLL